MSKKKILIIDDEIRFINPVLDRLEFLYGRDSFVHAQYFDEALAELQKDCISCISIDLIMPYDSKLKTSNSKLNGINALTQIRKKYEAIPIACFTVINEKDTIKIIEDLNTLYIAKSEVNAFYRLFDFFDKNHKV